MALRVVLADDSYLIREALEEVLSAEEAVEVVASCGDLDSLLAALERLQPDVVVTDIRMPPSGTDEGIRFAVDLRETHPGTGVVVLTQYAGSDYALRLFESGSQGRAYLLKERVSDRRQLVEAIVAVHEGGSVVDPKVVEALVDARSRSSELDELSDRELEVLALIARGKSNAAIAEELVLTKRAVEKHINSIFLKLGLPRDAEAEGVSRRVTAALMYLADRPAPPPADSDA
jgi:DNA-binding NarL/FixJ family response regulator